MIRLLWYGILDISQICEKLDGWWTASEFVTDDVVGVNAHTYIFITVGA